MARIKFEKGKQREFILKVLQSLGCPSLHELINRGVDSNYSSLKNYFCERRLMPENLFEELLQISGLQRGDFSFESVDDNWGQREGGKISRK